VRAERLRWVRREEDIQPILDSFDDRGGATDSSSANRQFQVCVGGSITGQTTTDPTAGGLPNGCATCVESKSSGLLLASLDATRVDHGNSGVPHKVLRVEGEQMRHLMDMHGRDEACVVHLYTGN
jgi:hypothetical protein